MHRILIIGKRGTEAVTNRDLTSLKTKEDIKALVDEVKEKHPDLQWFLRTYKDEGYVEVPYPGDAKAAKAMPGPDPAALEDKPPRPRPVTTAPPPLRNQPKPSKKRVK